MIRTLFVVVVLGASAPVAMAEVQPEAFDRTSRMRAVRRHAPVHLDGRLDDAAWAGAPASRGFWQRFPDEGKPPSHETEVRVLYDDHDLYVGVRAHDSQPNGIRGLLTRRDVNSQSDWLVVGVDSYHDRRTAFVFAINPAGVQRDMLLFEDSREDASWDAVWTAATQVDDGGWVAEFRIPLSQLRFSAHEHQEWGLQVLRVVARSGEESVWSPWPRSSPKVVSQFGTLGGIDHVVPSRRLELLPYATAGVGLLEDVDNDDPFHGTASARGSLGVDARYGLSSAFTLAATLNPDFGQVEADPSQVNLSGRELFFPEKRPFFLEGNDIFRFSLGQGDGDNSVEALFYTRRIGASPHLSAEDDADFVDEPADTTIYGAAKVSGKTGGWSFGLLDAVTAEETARLADLDDQGNAQESTRTIEPLTNYAVLRVRKDLRGGNTQLGGAVTAVHRDLDETTAAELHDQAYTGGLELQHRFGQDRYTANARLAGSWVHGSEEAIGETQRLIRHLYQRPDATHVELDPERTSLAGGALLWDVGKIDGGHWRYELGADTRTPGFEANDLGFQRGADSYVQWVWAQYRDDQAGEDLVDYRFNFNGWVISDWSPRILGFGGNLNGGVTFKNQWRAGGGFGIENPLWDPAALRGGSALRVDRSYNPWVNIQSDNRKRVWFAGGAWLWRRPIGDSWATGGDAGISIQARSNLDVFLGPSWEVRYEDTQYIDELEGADAMPHYVFGRIHQVATGLTLRGSWTFSPNLSLQLYAQPYIAAGAYKEYKEASDPHAPSYQDRFHTYTPDEVTVDRAEEVVTVDRDRDGMSDFSFDLPDFNVRELRSNVVLRWEYLPGSALFFIWSHGRSDSSTDGRYRAWNDAASLASAPGEHVVMVKANYWIGL